MNAILHRGFAPLAPQQIVEGGFVLRSDRVGACVLQSVPRPESGVEHAGIRRRRPPAHAPSPSIGGISRSPALRLILLFNFTLRYAASINHPLLQAIMLADQRQEAQKTQEAVEGHLSAMAMKLGELQAQMLRLDSLGERLARLAGLKPQDLPRGGWIYRARRAGARCTVEVHDHACASGRLTSVRTSWESSRRWS